MPDLNRRTLGKFDLYKISLKGVQPDCQEFTYVLDKAFFEAIEASDILDGKINVNVRVTKMAESFEFRFNISGTIQVPCDRCLDKLDLPIETNDTLYVKLGKAFDDDGDKIVVIPEDECEINIAWFLYEFVAIQIPIKHIHQSGECNKQMLSRLKKYRVVDHSNDWEVVDDGLDGDFGSCDSVDERIDPRWEGLKNIIDNN